jgi:hypothetical protein
MTTSSATRACFCTTGYLAHFVGPFLERVLVSRGERTIHRVTLDVDMLFPELYLLSDGRLFYALVDAHAAALHGPGAHRQLLLRYWDADLTALTRLQVLHAGGSILAFSHDVVAGEGLRVVAEAAPAAPAPLGGARINIDRTMPVQDVGHRTRMSVIRGYGDQGAASADPFGIGVRVLFRDPHAHQSSEHPTCYGAHAGPRQRGGKGTGREDRTNAGNGEHPKSRQHAAQAQRSTHHGADACARGRAGARMVAVAGVLFQLVLPGGVVRGEANVLTRNTGGHQVLHGGLCRRKRIEKTNDRTCHL